MVTIAIKTANIENNIKRDYTRLIQVLKPHSMSISVMCINVSCRYVSYKFKDNYIFLIKTIFI